MHSRNIIALILITASLICLFPGLTNAILTIQVGTTVPVLGKINLYDATRSIIGTIEELRAQGNYLVAFLILLFSVLVPIFKAICLLIMLFWRTLSIRQQLRSFVAIISKWSMADVFVVAVYLSFLATKTNDDINAWLHDGFYYFLSYCLLSILASQIIKVEE